MSERLKEAVLKTVEPAKAPGVRIPPAPTEAESGRAFFTFGVGYSKPITVGDSNRRLRRPKGGRGDRDVAGRSLRRVGGANLEFATETESLSLRLRRRNVVKLAFVRTG